MHGRRQAPIKRCELCPDRRSKMSFALADMPSVLNGEAVDHGCLMLVGNIVVAVDVDRLDLYHHAPEAGYHVNV
jgi:hypothetical protein